MKNWLSYKDAISIEENIPDTPTRKVLTAAELPTLGDTAQIKIEELPKLGEVLE